MTARDPDIDDDAAAGRGTGRPSPTSLRAPSFRDREVWLLPALLATLGAVILASGVNTRWFLALNDAGRVLPDAVWGNVTIFGLGEVCATVFFLAVARRHPRLLLLAVLVALVGTPLIQGAKALADPWARPYGELGGELIRGVGRLHSRHAMPSGHTATAFSMAAAICALSSRASVWWLAVSGAAAVGLSRIMCGQHWPADVCMGAALGWVAGWLGVALARRIDVAPAGRLEITLRLLFVAAAVHCLVTDVPEAGTLITKRGLGLAGLVVGLWMLGSLFRARRSAPVTSEP